MVPRSCSAMNFSVAVVFYAFAHSSITTTAPIETVFTWPNGQQRVVKVSLKLLEPSGAPLRRSKPQSTGRSIEGCSPESRCAHAHAHNQLGVRYRFRERRRSEVERDNEQ